MKDGYGREIDYLRISLTDKCSLRCGYCMPPEGIRHKDHSEILTFEELGRLVRIMSGLGIKRVRLTGGEPLVRRGAVHFISMLRNDCGLQRISMTSNGMMLADVIREAGGSDTTASKLKEAGLSDINISLDTLDPGTFRKLAGADCLDRILQGIDAAIAAGLEVKLNCVPLKGINDDEIIDLLRYAEGHGIDIRFIELMPIGCGRNYEGISASELTGQIEKEYGRSSEIRNDAPGKTDGPARYYSFERYKGRIGFISPLSVSFCEACNRVRLTSEGYLKLCLQYPDGTDLKTPLRGGASDREIEEIIMEAVEKKPASHSFGTKHTENDKRKMVEIGG